MSVCPITNQAKGYPFEAVVPDGLAVTGVVLSDHVKSVSWEARGAAYKGKAPVDLMDEVRSKIKSLLVIPNTVEPDEED